MLLSLNGHAQGNTSGISDIFSHQIYATPVTSYLQGRAQQQQYELQELERQKRELELQERRQQIEAENLQRQMELERQAAATATTESPDTILSCKFPGNAVDTTPAHAPVQSAYLPAQSIMLRVGAADVSLRAAGGWASAPHDIRENEFMVLGPFLGIKADSQSSGKGPSLPEQSQLVVDRYSGIAVIYTDPTAAGGADVPLFPGHCSVAERQF